MRIMRPDLCTQPLIYLYIFMQNAQDEPLSPATSLKAQLHSQSAKSWMSRPMNAPWPAQPLAYMMLHIYRYRRLQEMAKSLPAGDASPSAVNASRVATGV